MRAQAEQKLMEQKRPKRKYNNIPTESHGIKFDSKKEAKRYNELTLMVKAAEIQNLKLQHAFTLQEQFKTPDGELIRPVKYIADFTYEKDGELIIEDVKSEATRNDKVYRLKKRLMADKGYKIHEV